jgi:DNA-binding FadR family transcriptional regulator
MLSLGKLPPDGSLPSEQELARRYGVSRGTVREALLRLSTRGLVVQHPGRRTRALALDEVVSLESLSVALHGESRAHPDRWRLLEGYFALKREMTVELLAACCERACEEDLNQLGKACFALGDAARWAEEGWVRQEFALLRMAARAAGRPGHLLLIQSLERAFWGIAEWVLPHLEAQAVDTWAQCAMHALDEKNAQALRQQLPPLLQACDERLLGRLAPATHGAEGHEIHRADAEGHETHRADAEGHEIHRAESVPHSDEPSAPEAAGGELAGAVVPNLSGCRTGSRKAPPTRGSQPELASATSSHEPGHAPLGAASPSGSEGNGGTPMATASPGDNSCRALSGALGGALVGAASGPPGDSLQLLRSTLLGSCWTIRSAAFWSPAGGPYPWVETVLGLLGD